MSELLYGRRSVTEALIAQRRRFYRLWVEGKENEAPTGVAQEILDLAAEQKISVRVTDGGIFQRLTRERQNAQGLALEVEGYPYAEVEEILALARAKGEAPLLLLLDQVQDPQNLGTLIRTAEVVGVHGVIIPERRAAGVTPAVSNSSAGAVEHLLVAQVRNLNRTIEQLKREQVWIAGLDAGEGTLPLESVDLNRAIALVVGSEGGGLSRLTGEKCDFLISLAMRGRVASYNAAVAGSIALYAARQARNVA